MVMGVVMSAGGLAVGRRFDELLQGGSGDQLASPGDRQHRDGAAGDELVGLGAGQPQEFGDLVDGVGESLHDR